jgi:FlaG/FlaF family flagellin (archaellin)
MNNRYTNSRGISETVSVILVIALILVLAIVIYALIFGSVDPRYMKKSAYVAGTATEVDIPRISGVSDHVLSFLPQSGDPFYFTGQQTAGTSGTRATIKLLSPDGKIIYPGTSSLSGNPYGKQLYIYPNTSGTSTMCNYDVSDKAPPANLRPMPTGRWTVQLIDEEIHVVADSYDTILRYGTTSLPTAGGFVYGMLRSDCTAYSQTIHGTLPNYTNGPGGMAYTHFDGASSMIIPNDPGLSMTGDMAISLWMRPDTTGSTPANWHTVIGKGQIVGGQENDNYQLVTIGNDLYFEWGDTSTGQHYHVSTTGLNPLQNNQWGYVTVDVKGGPGGGVTIYNNGNPVPVQYYNNNNPSPYEGTPMTTRPAVNLQANNLPVNVGVQADPSNPFYYKGDIGAISLYNRALTPAEIAQNYAGYRA